MKRLLWIGALSVAACGDPNRIALAAVRAGPDRQSAIRTLAELGPAAAPFVPALVPLLDDPEVAVAAALALGEIGPAAGAAVPELLAASGASSAQLRAGACLALSRIAPGDPRVRAAVETMRAHDPDPLARQVAAGAATRLR